MNKKKRRDNSFVSQVFEASVANASSDAQNIILSYITEHVISFYPLRNFKVHITICQCGFSNIIIAVSITIFVMNDTKIIKLISSENKHIRAMLLSATYYRMV